MSTSIMQIALALSLATGLAAGCSKDEPQRQQAEPSSASAEPPAALTDDARQHIRRALDAYEQVRAKLVRDDGTITEHARVLATAATEARGRAPEALRDVLGSLATEASQLAEAPSSDLPALRREFAEVSRQIIALLSAERSLAEGLHVFECGMTEGYGKWVQRSAEISNPYMGSRMPGCGAPAELGPS